MDHLHPPESGACSQHSDNLLPHRMQVINRVEELRRATQWLYLEASQLGLSTPEVERLDFCLNELLTNVIFHAYEDSEEHAIDISLSSGEKKTLLIIEDDGKTFDPVAYDGFQMPDSLEKAAGSGYGITLVRSFVDELHHERIGNKNRVTVTLNRAD